MNKIPVLLDTDIGSDIDDALALAYLLRQPACELVGITTVAKNAEKRASLCDMLCRIEGRTDIPIHSGSSDAILDSRIDPAIEQAKVLSEYPHRTDFEKNSAVRFMAETIMSRPGEITLLTIGPLSNVGLLFATYPEIPSILKNLVIMGGLFSFRLPNAYNPEYNIAGDAHAAAIVYNRSRSRSIGTDVTFECKLSKIECEPLWSDDLMIAVSKMAGVWFDHAHDIVFHDPLAAASIFDETVCQWSTGRVEVDLSFGKAMGYTYFDKGKEPSDHTVACGVNVQRFFDHYRKVLVDGAQ